MISEVISSGKLQGRTGGKGLLSTSTDISHKVTSWLSRESVDTVKVIKHNEAFEKARNLKIIALALENKKFRDQDFLLFLEIKNNFVKGLEEYQGLNSYLRLFRVAIEAKNTFLAIEQLELLHRSSKQQTFYQLVFDLLSRHIPQERFYELIHQELAELLPKIKTEKGQKALNYYVHSLDSLTQQDELGLQLLYLFKKYQLADYSILKDVSNLVNYINDKNIRDLKAISGLVKKHETILKKLGKILEIPAEINTCIVHTKMLQYLALESKYRLVDLQFERLIRVLKDWEKSYQTVKNIRKQYPWINYEQPKEFQLKIDYLDLYKKYQDYCLLK